MLPKIGLNTFDKFKSFIIPFVFFREPKASKVTLLTVDSSKKNNKTTNTTTGYFIAAPFETSLPIHKIEWTKPKKYSWEKQSRSSPTKSFVKKEHKQAFISSVNKAKKMIGEGVIKKIVVSRIIEIYGETNVFALFLNLLSDFPDAMTYLWFHPNTGVWVGATPEKLLSLKNNILKTCALAGTKLFTSKGNIHWHNKEIMEQQYVAQSIHTVLKDNFAPSEITSSATYTKRVNQLVHLCTDFSVKTRKIIDLKKMIAQLHPTPAVGGLPKAAADKLYHDHIEGHDRKLYAGYLGLTNFANNADLYVNIRCARCYRSGLKIYVGAGITADSDPESEWIETGLKAQSIGQALY